MTQHFSFRNIVKTLLNGHKVAFNSSIVRFRNFNISADALNDSANVDDIAGYIEVPAVDRTSGERVMLVLDQFGYDVE